MIQEMSFCGHPENSASETITDSFDSNGSPMEKVTFLTDGALESETIISTAVQSHMNTLGTVSMEGKVDQRETQSYPEFETGPFEGVEKRLIIEFFRDALRDSPMLKNGSLRSLGATQWQLMLDKAACQILSYKELETESGSCTAYLLSESSLFVYDHRVVLKTCG